MCLHPKGCLRILLLTNAMLYPIKSLSSPINFDTWQFKQGWALWLSLHRVLPVTIELKLLMIYFLLWHKIWFLIINCQVLSEKMLQNVYILEIIGINPDHSLYCERCCWRDLTFWGYQAIKSWIFFIKTDVRKFQPVHGTPDILFLKYTIIWNILYILVIEKRHSQ